MNRLIYLLPAATARAHQELSYSVMSALKQGADGVQMELWSDAAQQRPDLPLHPHPLPQAGLTRRDALVEALAENTGPVCLIATDTVFRAPPAALFQRLQPGRALVHDRDGWLAGRAAWAQALQTAAKDGSARFEASTELYNLSLLGLHPADINCLKNAEGYDRLREFGLKFSEIEQFDLSTRLKALNSDLAFGHDLVGHYAGYIRHVYHGRFDAIFPQGAPVNTAMADRLPDITEPPQPPLLKLKAKVHALRRRMGRGSEIAYLSYLCTFAAPSPEGRNVWANIALDQVQASARPKADWRKDLYRLAPEALPSAGLSPETRARWLGYWSEGPEMSPLG